MLSNCNLGDVCSCVAGLYFPSERRLRLAITRNTNAPTMAINNMPPTTGPTIKAISSMPRDRCEFDIIFNSAIFDRNLTIIRSVLLFLHWYFSYSNTICKSLAYYFLCFEAMAQTKARILCIDAAIILSHINPNINSSIDGILFKLLNINYLKICKFRGTLIWG